MTPKKSLNVGDEVYLEKGCYAEVEIPKKYVYSNRPFDNSLTNHSIQLGILYTNEEITKRSIKEEKNHIANMIFSAFLNKGYEISFKKCKSFVDKNIDMDEKIELTNFLFKEGTFVITSCILEPGGRGHNDYYPPRWTFYAKRKENDNDTIKFYDWQYYNDEWHTITKINCSTRPSK